MRLEDILYQLTDGTHSTPKYMEDGVPFLSVKDISNGYISFDNTKYISFDEHIELSKRCNPEKGDILLSKVGTTGVPVLIETDIHFNIFVSLALLKFFTHFINGKYLIYLIQSPLIQEQVKENTRGVGNKNWVLKSIANTLITLPPLSEQKRIVAKIEELLPFIEQYAKKEQELTALHQAFPERLKKSILQAAIQGKLTEQNPNDEPAVELVKRIQAEKERLILEKKIKKPKQHSEIIVRDNSHYEIVDGVERCIDDEIPFEIPESWCWVRLGDIFEITSSKRVHQSEWQSSGIPFYRAREIVSLKKKEKLRDPIFISKDIYDKNTTISGKPQIGDLLVTGVGTLGQAFLVENKSPFYFKDGNVVWFKNFSQIYTSYILYFMESSFFIEQIYSKSQGTTVGTFTIENAKNIFMPFPPLSEQQSIVSKIEKLFSSLENLTK